VNDIVRLEPVREESRISTIDTLRGFSLLGILMVNMQFFVFPSSVMFDPSSFGDFEGLNKLSWIFTYLFFNQKMMAIFSMLFGAGLILMFNRAEEKGITFGKVYYRRLLWLFLIGMIHAYLIWYGDILVTYALCGLLLFPVKRLSAKWLAALGAIILLIGIGLATGAGWFFGYMQEQKQAVVELEERGEEPSVQQKKMAEAWDEMNSQMSATGQKAQNEVEAMRGSYLDMIKYQWLPVLLMQTQAFLFYIGWRALGMMLLGMAFMKMGIFSGARTTTFYLVQMIIGYLVGFALTGYGILVTIDHNFDFVKFFQGDSLFDYIGSIFVCMGHVAVVMLICKLNVLRSCTDRLAAVGRMAFTNYLTQSILMTFCFYGWGLGLFGSVDRFAQLGFVAGVWIVQLIWSPIWLKHFQFGPAEWLWRTLTYLKAQPFRRVESTESTPIG